MKIAVVLGGISPERNVSIASGLAVASALRENGHSVILVDPARGKEGLIESTEAHMEKPPTTEELAAFSPRNIMDCIQSGVLDDCDIAFLVTHGSYGEDGYLQSLLDLRGIPYTGSAMRASAIAMDKAISKRLLDRAGIPVPPGVEVSKQATIDTDLCEEIREIVGKKLVIKPNDQGSTVGVTIVEHGNLDDIAHGIHEALQYSDVAVIEQFIPGQELTVAVLGEEAFLPVEIRAEGGFYDYNRKYTKGHTEYLCPAPITEEITEYIQKLAIEAHHTLGCRAYSRVDFRLTPEGEAYCLEVNTLPGMTATSLVPKAAQASGMSFSELCETIIKLSLEN